MPDINILAVLVAAIASFVASGIWYVVLGDAMVRLQGEWRGAEPPDKPEAWRMLVFFGNGLIIAVAVAILIGLTDISGVAESAGLGLLLWVGFVLTQWIGSIAGEDTPPKLAAIHGGDWLLHMLIITVIIGVWQ